MLLDQWMLWSFTVALPASSPSITARSTTTSRSLTSTTLPSCCAPAPWVAWIWFALVWTFMNLYGHVGLVLYGPSFVALHLSLYELVRTCMDCGLYKMFSDAYYDVWTILWSICEIYELHEIFIWFGVPYTWPRNKKKTKKAFLLCATLLGHTAKRTSTSCAVTLPFFLPCVKASTRRSICRVPVERLTAKTLFAGHWLSWALCRVQYGLMSGLPWWMPRVTSNLSMFRTCSN